MVRSLEGGLMPTVGLSGAPLTAMPAVKAKMAAIVEGCMLKEWVGFGRNEVG